MHMAFHGLVAASEYFVEEIPRDFHFAKMILTSYGWDLSFFGSSVSESNGYPRIESGRCELRLHSLASLYSQTWG